LHIAIIPANRKGGLIALNILTNAASGKNGSLQARHSHSGPWILRMNQLLRTVLVSALAVTGVFSVVGYPASQTRELPSVSSSTMTDGIKIVPQRISESAAADRPDFIPRRKVAGISAPFASARNVYNPAPIRLQAPRTAMPTGGTMRGVVLTNTTWDYYAPEYGIYEYPLAQGAPVCTPIHIDPEHFYFIGGVYMGETFWGAVPVYNSNFEVSKMTFYTFDTETWTVIDEQVGDPSFSPLDMTFDETTGTVYAVYVNMSSFKCTLAKWNTQYGFYEDIASLPEFVSGLAANATGELYGLTTKGVLWKIDKTDGTVIEIGDTGLKPYWATSAAIDPKNGQFYYALALEGKAEMYEIDPETAVATKLYDFENDEQIFCMYIHHEKASPHAPAMAQDLAITFENASLHGTVSFRVPTTYFDGTEATGAVDYKVCINGTEAIAGTTSFGAFVSENLTIPSAGAHTISVVLANNEGESPAAKIFQWIGGDIPKAVTGAKATWTDGIFTVKWNAVSEGVNGGYVDASAVTYDVVRFPDEVLVAENIMSTEITDNVTEPVNNVLSYHYSITARYEGQVSEAATTSKTSLGYVLPPYLNTLDNSAMTAGFKIVDGNSDGKKWGYNSANGCLRISYNSKIAMDDWVFTPAIQLEKGKAYQFSLKAKAHNDSDNERLEAAVSTDTNVSSVVSMIIDATDIISKEYVTLSGMFIPQESGRYHLAIHGISDKNKYYLYVDDIAVSEGAELARPASVNGLNAVPDASGAMKAEISFNAPIADLAGETLSSLEKIEILRDETVIKTFTAPAPGTELSFTDTEAKQGFNTYTVIPYGLSGAGESASITCFVGLNKPAAPEYVNAYRGSQSGTATAEWPAVTLDINGKTLPEGAVTYDLYIVEGQEMTLVGENLNETSMQYRVCEDTDKQRFVYFEVVAKTSGGEAMPEVSELIPVGAAYTLPFNESFANGRLTNNWGVLPLSSTGSCMIGQDTSIDEISSFDGDNGLFIIQGIQANDRACIFSGAIYIADVNNPTLSLYYFNYNCSNKIAVQIADYTTGETTLLAEATMSGTLPEAWMRMTADLSAYAGHEISIYLIGTCVNGNVVVLDNITVDTGYDHNLKVRNFSMPGRVVTGISYNISLTVENVGLQDASGYMVELFRDDTKVASTQGKELASGDSETFIFEQVADILSTKTIDYHAVVTFDADQVKDDNCSACYTMKVTAPEGPAITDLKAIANPDGVNLTWSSPDLTVVPMDAVTEDLSGLEPFSIGLATTSVFDDFIGNWSMIDSDGLRPFDMTSGGNLVTYPNSGKPISFIVLDCEEFGVEGWEAHSGTKMFVSFASNYGCNDDWMISPMLSGAAQTIKFYAKSITHMFGAESFEFFYSSDLPVVGAFRKLHTVAEVPERWTEYSYDLPEGARYFAIRCTSNGTFALCVDDLTYIPESPLASLSIQGFNIYRDGARINDANVDTPNYIDTGAEPGDHTYTVTTVYNLGESELSNEASILVSAINAAKAGIFKVSSLSGNIIIEGAAGCLATVSATDGKVMFNGILKDKTIVSVPTGVYIVKIADKAVKISVI